MPDGTFLYARYPRPVAGCAAEVAQRIMEVAFGAMGKAIPERLFAAPAGTSGNFEALPAGSPNEPRMVARLGSSTASRGASGRHR
jgi:N-methylhydantoinase B